MLSLQRIIETSTKTITSNTYYKSIYIKTNYNNPTLWHTLFYCEQS